MVHVEFVNLSERGIRFPHERVGMVVTQPHLPRDSFTEEEPYQFVPKAKQRQLAVLGETLAVARLADHGALKTHFTIIPEYGIPGLDGVGVLEDALRSKGWPDGSVLVGGTDGLTRDQYAELLQGDRTHVEANHNGLDRIGGDQWVNCAITWVKSADGTLERWIQPKLHPAWEEQDTVHQHMFRGRSVYMFKGQLDNDAHFLFGTLVCFDWVAHLKGRKLFQWILADIHQRAGDGQLPLTWLFVIQRNPKPSHHTFLSSIEQFFNQIESPNADRHNACLVFANTAGKGVPGRANEFGACSVVLSSQALFKEPTCSPTFSKGGPEFRDGSDILQACACKDVFFRERGACIHSFAQINPGSVVAGAAGHTVAVENAAVFPISRVPEPRAPGAAVPAVIKWLNDVLDEIHSLPHKYNPALAAAIDDSHARTVAALRALSSKDATHAVKLSAQESTTSNTDDWASKEMDGVQHVVHTLDIVGAAPALQTIGVERVHAATVLNGQQVDVVAICGTSHEECVEHLKPQLLENQRRQMLLVSRDMDNTSWCPKFSSILEPVAPRPGDERKFTDPAGGSLHIGYQDLLSIFKRADDAADIAKGINAELTA